MISSLTPLTHAGALCVHATQSSRPLRYPLEVYKTPNCGWGVWSWAPIANGSLVCIMYGKILRWVPTTT